MSSVGASPESMIACLLVAFCQLSFVAIFTPVESCSSRIGSANLPLTVSDGPMARAMTSFGSVPVTMNPPIRTSSPVPTFERVEILPTCTSKNGVGEGVGVGDGVAVGDGVSVGVGVGVADGVGVGVGLTVGDGVGVGVGVGVGSGVPLMVKTLPFVSVR